MQRRDLSSLHFLYQIYSDFPSVISQLLIPKSSIKPIMSFLERLVSSAILSRRSTVSSFMRMENVLYPSSPLIAERLLICNFSAKKITSVIYYILTFIIFIYYDLCYNICYKVIFYDLHIFRSCRRSAGGKNQT